MRIRIIPGLCDGNALCVKEAPDLLAMNDDDEVRVLKESVDEGRREAARRAVQSCPKAALRLED